MQSKIDLMLAYGNKLALSLSIKESDINKHMIQHQKQMLYCTHFVMEASNIHHCLPTKKSKKYEDSFGKMNSERGDTSLCNVALNIVEIGFKLADQYIMRNKLIIEESLSNNAHSQRQDQANIFDYPFQNFKDLDMNDKANKEKIKKIVTNNYWDNPEQTKKLVGILNIPPKEFKKWLKYSQNSRKRFNLRKQVLQKGTISPITLANFKKMARKIYRSKLFRSTDKWSIDFIKKHQLEKFVELPQIQDE